VLKPSNRAEHRVYIFAADSLVTVIPRCRRRDRHSFRRLCLPCCFHVNGFDTHSEALDMAVAEGANFSDMVEIMNDGGLSSAYDQEGEGGYIISCSCQEELCSVKKKERTQWKKISLHPPSSISPHTSPLHPPNNADSILHSTPRPTRSKRSSRHPPARYQPPIAQTVQYPCLH